MKGTIVSYDYKKEFGIILGEDKKEVFVYQKDLDFLTLLDAGDKVEYQIEQSAKGPKAVNLKIIKDSLFRSTNSSLK
ncbi:MAG: cold shock domain-containing protein [Candidatus Thermoplasmatota archaeon]|nr:cold shock domain-containing protein [Candidatus Thermoplasmatota archaeon]